MIRRGALTLLVAQLLAGCEAGYDSAPIGEPLTLGDGRTIPVEVLERGRLSYLHNCRSCHGDRGEGNGPAAAGLRPAPRDLTRERFKIKFAAVESGSLPTDDDLRHVLRHGLGGTAMLPWDVAGAELDALVQYLKTFSPRWRKDAPGAPITIPADPWVGREEEAVRAGDRLYHTQAQCATCHPAYAPEGLAIRPNAWLPAEAKDSDYRVVLSNPAEIAALEADESPLLFALRDPRTREVLRWELKQKAPPPDFLEHQMRAVHDDPQDPGHALRDLYRTIAIGIPGTAMPGFRRAGGDPAEDAANAADIWAMAHYLDALRRLRATPEALRLRESLRAAPQ